MKTVSGKLISSKPISLSKAAKILSGFAGYEHGASEAVSVYLNRAADAFNNLVSFHKELKNPHSYFKDGTPRVKIEENPVVGKVESRGKSKKNLNFEVEVEGLKSRLDFKGDDEKDLRNERESEKDLKKMKKKKVKAEQISNGVGEEMEEKSIKENLKINESVEFEQATLPQVGEKTKKKHKRDKLRDEEPIKIERSLDGESGDKETQVLVQSGKGKIFKQESVGMEKLADEPEQGSVNKRDRKKRKRRDDEESAQSIELVERKSKNVDDRVAIDLAEQNDKKKKKRRKTERED